MPAATPAPLDRLYRACALLTAAGLVALGILAQRDPARAFRLVAEDGPLEWGQVLSLCAAAVLLACAAWRRRGPVGGLLLLAIAGLLFVVAEELSWGQRLLGLRTPDAVRALNRQREMTFHNLSLLHELRHAVPIVLAAWGCALCMRQARGRARSAPGGQAEFLRPAPALGFQLALIPVPYAAAALGLPAAWFAGTELHPHADWRLASETGESLFYFTAFLHALSLRARARSRPIAGPASR